MPLSNNNKVKLPNLDQIAIMNNNPIDDIQDSQENTEDIRKIKKTVLEQAKQESQQIIENAKKQAELIIEDGNKIAQKAYETQKELGYNDGKNQGQMEYASLIGIEKENFEMQLETLKSYRDEIFEAIKPNLILCIAHLCKKIIYHEFDRYNFIINNMIDHQLQMLKDQTELTIHISKEDYKKLNTSSFNKDNIQVKINEDFSHGDIKIVCDSQEINFSIDDEIDRLIAQLGV